MITYWQQEDGKLVKKDEEELNRRMKTWVDARMVTRDDIVELEEKFNIESENILDVLDPDELSRIEYNEDKDYTLTIMRLPVFSPGDDIPYFCAPLGIITKGNLFITICWTDCEVLKDFAANRIRELSLNDFPAFTIRFMSRADLTYLRYLKEINRRATTIQNEMLRSVQNRELVQLLNIQKSLVYFATSLKSNQMLLEKFRKTKLFKLDEEDVDWLDDVEIDNRQAMEMADTYTNIMAQMNDSFSSVLSNNLNIVMKTMTAWNLVLMLPTLVTSFFGANIPLPWSGERGWKWMGVVALSGICILTAIMGWFLFMKHKFNTFDEKKKVVKLNQHRAARKEKKVMAKVEKAAERYERLSAIAEEKSKIKANLSKALSSKSSAKDEKAEKNEKTGKSEKLLKIEDGLEKESIDEESILLDEKKKNSSKAKGKSSGHKKKSSKKKNAKKK